MAEKHWYRGKDAIRKLQTAAAKVCKDRIKNPIQDSPFVGIMLDESLDISVQKKLVVYLKLVCDGQPMLQFGENVEVKDGRAETIL